jgi:dTDP-4-amino-4,6-dideoxygalactose transaminase
VQAAILQIKLRHLERWNQGRTQAADRYQQLLAGVEGVQVPQVPQGGTSVWNQYTILIDAAAIKGGEYRDRIRALMQEQGVQSMVYYPLPLHLQAVYQDLGYTKGSFPASEQASHQVLALPMFPEITTDQQERVVSALKQAVETA